MRKVAFLVATDECPEDPGIPKLLFPKADAETLAEILTDKETCGFEPYVQVNEPSHKILKDLYNICGQLKADDTLLFYYSGHGYRRGNELCLVSSNTTLASLIPTSVKATEVLGYLRDSSAKRRILVLDCCYAGVIGLQYKAADTDSSLDALGTDFGTCILTASTSIQLAEEREKDGHGLFTKALIDCLRDPPKDSINVDDWYLYAVDRLRVSGSQRPTKFGYVEGYPIEIGNFRKRFAELRQKELEQLILTARDKLKPYVQIGTLSEEQVESIISDLQCDETRLLPYRRTFRHDVIRFLKDEANFFDVFAKGHIPPQPPMTKASLSAIPSQSPPPLPAIPAHRLSATTTGVNYMAALGRLMMAAIFLVSGFLHVFHLSSPADVRAPIAVITTPDWAFYVATGIELVGGSSLALGLGTRYVALYLAIFMLAMSIGSDFGEFDHFMKNLAIAGGLIQVWAFGSGGLAITHSPPRAV